MEEEGDRRMIPCYLVLWQTGARCARCGWKALIAGVLAPAQGKVRHATPMLLPLWVCRAPFDGGQLTQARSIVL